MIGHFYIDKQKLGAGIQFKGGQFRWRNALFRKGKYSTTSTDRYQGPLQKRALTIEHQ